MELLRVVLSSPHRLQGKVLSSELGKAKMHHRNFFVFFLSHWRLIHSPMSWATRTDAAETGIQICTMLKVTQTFSALERLPSRLLRKNIPGCSFRRKANTLWCCQINGKEGTSERGCIFSLWLGADWNLERFLNPTYSRNSTIIEWSIHMLSLFVKDIFNLGYLTIWSSVIDRVWDAETMFATLVTAAV